MICKMNYLELLIIIIAKYGAQFIAMLSCNITIVCIVNGILIKNNTRDEWGIISPERSLFCLMQETLRDYDSILTPMQ